MGGICYKIRVSLLERIATAKYKVDEHSQGCLSAVMVIMCLEVKWVKASHLECDRSALKVNRFRGNM